MKTLQKKKMDIYFQYIVITYLYFKTWDPEDTEDVIELIWKQFISNFNTYVTPPENYTVENVSDYVKRFSMEALNMNMMTLARKLLWLLENALWP